VGATQEDERNVANNKNKDKDSTNIISITNHKNTLRSFIEKSPLGVRFGIIVLFYVARESLANPKNRIPADQSLRANDLSSFSFTSKEFFEAYSQLASDMGLTKYLVRQMAFSEFMLTLEYIALVREEELSADYRFKVNFDDLKWLASISLQQITGGHGLSASDVMFTPNPPISPSLGAPRQESSYNRTIASTAEMTASMIKDLSLNIFSQGENELNAELGAGHGGNNDSVPPRSKDYGLNRPYFAHRVPPTTYRFREPDDTEWKRIIKEFFTGQKCIICNAEVQPQQFDVWIGEPLQDNATPTTKRDQRMTDMVTDVKVVGGANRHDDREETDFVDAYQHHFIDADENVTDREILTYNYGIIPMDGRDAFIAFAKPKKACPNCGANPSDSVSLMPKY
jgi:hypothetical protein